LASTFTVLDKVFNNPLYFFHEVVHALSPRPTATDMGKKDFHSIYSEACRELGSRPTIKVSHFSDRYDQNKNFAGVIVYHNRGSFTWYNEQGVAKGYKGRAVYVILRCTDSWPEEAFKRAGEGMVHDYLYKFLFDNDFNKRQTCCGGFAVMKGTLKYSSIWLNKQSSGSEAQRPWQSDGNKLLSKGEELLVDIAVRSWKGGGGNIVHIPDLVDFLIKMNCLSTRVPRLPALRLVRVRNQA